jgi:hypothetical protein
LGDSHDFIKYALLRHLHGSLNLHLGVNWYLTDRTIDHSSNNDGEKRHHLKGGTWQRWDEELFESIRIFEEKKNRLLKNVASHKILPADTLYFEEIVPASARVSWHQRGMKVLSGADIVFLDPDNGFEVKSASKKKLPKYALYDEAIDYHKQGKITVSIQFARQCCPERKARDIRKNLYERADYNAQLPVLRGRVAPNILFLFLAPPDNISMLSQTLIDFAAKSEGKAELIY